MNNPGFTVWLTGLPSAGKTTLGVALAKALRDAGLKVHHFDGDEVRVGLCADLDFTEEGRHVNNLRVAYCSSLLNRYGVCTVVSQITPYRRTRLELRKRLSEFVMVFVDCPLEMLVNRDVKGLYKKALAGEIKNFTGVDDPYEPPMEPEVHLRTDQEEPAESLRKILAYLGEAGLLANAPLAEPADGQANGYGPGEEAVVVGKLKELGYL